MTVSLVAVCLFLSSCFLVSDLHAQTPAHSLEYRVKAAFLLNFTKFVEWPEAAFRSADAPITICIVGEDPFGDVLDRTLAGETVNGHAIRAERPASEGDLRVCHILFVGRSERERFPQIVSRLEGSSTLTVSELPAFSEEGGMIEFVVEEGKARFYINAATTEAAGLKLSSRLLRVAKEIKGF
jgi:hypothetical protein